MAKFKKINSKNVVIKNDDRGSLIKLLNLKKKKDKIIKEVYITTVLKNKIKGWNMHKKHTTNIFLVHGSIFLYLMNKKKYCKVIDSKFSKIIKIKPKIKFAFKGISKESFIISMSTGIYDKNEIQKFDFNSF